MAAFSTCVNGGLIPQAKHGGTGVCALAVDGSKFVGNGFEKEQIGHIQVLGLESVLFEADAKGVRGLSPRGTGDAVELRDGA